MSELVLLRRSVLTGLGLAAGGFALGLANAAEPGKPKPIDVDLAKHNDVGLRPNLFVHVLPDGTVNIVCQRSEMGQGVRSTLHVLIADELGASLARVAVQQADGDKAYGDQNTDGSHSIRGSFDELRKVGAAARTMLIAAAAKRWNVPPAACNAHDHQVHHAPTGRALGFGELATAAGKLPLPKPESITLRPRAELPHLGKELPLRDGPDIVTGKARFGADFTLPGMLTAVIARPPVLGGRVKSHDPAKALAVPGVRRIVELPVPTPPYAFQPLGGLAVVADHTWAAMRGRAALAIAWDDGSNAAYDSVAYRETLLASVRAPGRVARNVGDADGALARAAKVVEAEYWTAHLAHATMEPPCAVAKVDANAWAAVVPGRVVLATALLFALITLVFHQFFRMKTRQIQAENRATEAQLRLLQAQIEPHFLFNTLANVVSLMDTDTLRAKSMLESFVDYLRASMPAFGRADAAAHTLGGELDLVEAYLRIVQTRMEDRLRFSIDVPAELRGVRLPPLTVQPLVENAVVHGLEPTLDGGAVRVTARRVDGAVVVTVADDGAGVDAAPGVATPRRTGAGTALANIRERLGQTYGRDASLSIAPGGVRGTDATLVIPAVA